MQSEVDFRVQFGQMPGNAVISRAEFAQLLCTTPGSISQLAYRGLLPKTAFPNLRRACWFVRDIREWLDHGASRSAPIKAPDCVAEATKPRRIGRPRFEVAK
jgi:hypothetical protein